MVAVLYCFLNGEVSVLGNHGIPMQKLPGESSGEGWEGLRAGLLAWPSHLGGGMLNHILGNIPRIDSAELDSGLRLVKWSSLSSLSASSLCRKLIQPK